MKRNCIGLVVIIGLTALLFGPSLSFAQVTLGSAQSFAVLGGSTVINTGATQITGNVGVSPGSTVTGFPPGVITAGSIQGGNAISAQAQTDLAMAYNAAAATPCVVDLTGQNLGGFTLTPGVYCFGSSASLTGTLTLDFQNNPNALFMFKAGSSLITAAGSSVLLVNGGGSCPLNLFWQVGTSATLGPGSNFAGNILALNGITLSTNARLSGRALARNGSVTLETNSVTVCINGDANGDGRVSVADIFYLINFLFTGGPAPLGPADVNADTRVSVADVFYLINFLFTGGPAPL